MLMKVTQMARDEAAGSESRAENKYDTRATESSYLAAGQGERLLALRRLSSFFSGIAEGQNSREICPLFELADDAGTAWFLLAPDGGGRRVLIDGETVVVVTPASPAGRLLAEAAVGDSVRIGAGAREYEVISRR